MLRFSKSPSSVDNDMSDNEKGDDDNRDNEDGEEGDGNNLNKTVNKGGGLSTVKFTKYVLIFALVKNSDLCPIHISLSSLILVKASCFIVSDSDVSHSSWYYPLWLTAYTTQRDTHANIFYIKNL